MSDRERRVLIVGVGNTLRGDDGFGPAVIRALEAEGGLPSGVRTLEVGLGSAALVLELLEGYDALLLVDAVDRDGVPGSFYILQPDIPEVEAIPSLERWAWSNESCQTLPSRALVMARAAGALPDVVRIIGCQPAETEEFSTALSAAVQAAVPRALEAIRDFLNMDGEHDGQPDG